jgi:hypothetical protein
MARPSKQSHLSAHQAAFVLEKALADRKLSASDVKHYLSVMHDEISELEERLASLRSAAVEPVKHLVRRGAKAVTEAVTNLTGKASAPKKRKKPVSPEVAASRQLQGQYLGYMRQIPKTKRASFQKISRTEGREAAVAAMKKALGK